MLLAAPGLGPGTLDPATVSHADIPPTVLALVGLQVSNHFMGRDLLAPAPADMSTLSVIDLVVGWLLAAAVAWAIPPIAHRWYALQEAGARQTGLDA